MKTLLLKAKIWVGYDFINEQLQYLLGPDYIVRIEGQFLCIYKEAINAD